jgi:hypothetical protein
MSVKHAWRVATIIAGGAIACGPEPTPPGVVAFSGDFTLVQADDWVANQSCNYVIPTDEWVCSWGRLTITANRSAISVRGFDVHKGSVIGPPIFRDSVTYTVAVRVLDGCTVAIDSTGVTPNGKGTLKADTLRFAGQNTIGDSLSWAYLVVHVQRAIPCA